MAFMPSSGGATLAPPPAPTLPWLLGLAVAIALLSWIAPDFDASGVAVSPLAPALVVALGGSALWGWRALPAVALGAVAAAWEWPLRTPDASHGVAAATLIAQAAFGGMLMRRSGRSDDLALDNRPALRRLVAAAIASGLIGGVMLVAGELLASADATQRPFTVAMVRATADASSIVLLMPILMAFASPLASRWQARRRSVALPLFVLTALMLVAFAGIHERDRQQAQQRFERDAEVVFGRTQALLDMPVLALQALKGAFEGGGQALAPTQFDSLAQPWVKRSLGVTSIGWIDAPVPTPMAAPATAPAVATAAAAASAPPGPPPAALRGPVSLRHALGALPAGPTAGAAGSFFDGPVVRQAVARAAVQVEAVASPPVPIGAALDARPGVVLLQGLPGQSGAARLPMVYVLLSPEALVAPVVATRSDALRGCLFDADLRLERRHLAGATGCETSAAAADLMSREANFDYAGQRWTMRITQPVRTTGGVWLFALPALLGGALLAALLAGMTGQVQRVRDEARSRSDELRHEIDQRAKSLAIHDRTVHALMDTVQIGMALIDPEGRIRRVNAAFAELAGVNAASLQHQSLDDVLVDNERPAPGRFARLIAEAGENLVHQPMRLRNAEAHVMPALVTLRVLRDESGLTLAAVCAVHDLSENLRRRQVERVLGDVLGLSGPPPAASAAAPTTAGPAAADQQVLCVTRQPGLVDELRTALHDRPRIALARADTDAQALDAVKARAPRLVLLDLELPEADGLSLLRSLAAHGVAVVAMSRDLRPQRIDAAFDAGARACLTLPPETRELLAVIDDLL